VSGGEQRYWRDNKVLLRSEVSTKTTATDSKTNRSMWADGGSMGQKDSCTVDNSCASCSGSGNLVPTAVAPPPSLTNLFVGDGGARRSGRPNMLDQCGTLLFVEKSDRQNRHGNLGDILMTNLYGNIFGGCAVDNGCASCSGSGDVGPTAGAPPPSLANLFVGDGGVRMSGGHNMLDQCGTLLTLLFLYKSDRLNRHGNMDNISGINLHGNICGGGWPPQNGRGQH
jgi:hypothetical protein